MEAKSLTWTLTVFQPLDFLAFGTPPLAAFSPIPWLLLLKFLWRFFFISPTSQHWSGLCSVFTFLYLSLLPCWSLAVSQPVICKTGWICWIEWKRWAVRNWHIELWKHPKSVTGKPEVWESQWGSFVLKASRRANVSAET